MKPRQMPWKWLLLGLVALFLVGLAVLPRQIGNSSELRDRVIAALSTWTGATVTLTEPLTVRYFPPLSIRGGFVLTNASRLPLVQSITARDVKISLSLPDLLLGRISVDALRLSRPKITLKEAAPVISPDETPQALIANMLAGAPVGVVRMRRGTISTASGSELISNLEARFDTSAGGGALSALGSFDFRGETVHFAIDSGKISETKISETETGPSAPVTLRLTSEPVVAKLTGTVSLDSSLRLDGNMLVEMGNVRQFLKWVGIALPEGQSLRRLSAEGTVHWSGSTLIFDDGSYTLDGNSADGLLAITMGDRPSIEGTLAFERLILDPYLVESKADEAAAPDGSLFDWALLKYFDADLRISAAQVTTSTMKLGRGGFTITAKQGVMSGEVGELELCGGQAAGRIDLDVSEDKTKASVVGSLTDVAINSCLEPFGLGIPVKGIGGLKTDLSTEGYTVGELIRRLSGDLKLNMRNGAVPVDFPRLLAASTGLDDDGWSRDSVTSFDSLNADCRLSAGHIWCQMFNMKTRRGLISGSGDVDMGQQTLDWDFLFANPIAPLKASQLVMDTPPRVTIRGPLSQPKIRRADRPTLGEGSTQTSPRGAPVSPR